MRKLQSLLATLFCALLAAQAWAAETVEHEGTAVPDAVDDRQTLKLLHDQGERLITAGRTVKIAALIEQLKTASCRVKTAELPKEPPAPEKLYEQMKRSVIVVSGLYKCDKCKDWHTAIASGFVLSASGVCCTNYHVVDSPARETLIAMTADGRIAPVKAVLAASKADDVAIIQLDAQDLTPVPLLPGAPVGARVGVISHPDNRFFMYTSGVISRYFTTRRANADATMMAITADYARGSSGGPVFNERGEVVGMVASTHSIYYDEKKDGKKDNLQMVVKQCVPAASIAKLIQR